MRQLGGSTFQIPSTPPDFLPWPRPKFLKAERGAAGSCLKTGCCPKHLSETLQETECPRPASAELGRRVQGRS